MAGVIDENGQQWEKCNICGEFIRFPQDLGFVKPRKNHPYGTDICVKCVDIQIRTGKISFNWVTPAPTWIRKEY